MKSKKCIYCGMCVSSCPVFKILRNEKVSPRGKAIMIDNEFLDKMFYACTLCGNCRKNCPVDVDLKLREFREKLVKEGFETNAGKEMKKNLKEFGNPFGKGQRIDVE